MGSPVLNSFWLIEADPHMGGSITLRPHLGIACTKAQFDVEKLTLEISGQCWERRGAPNSAQEGRIKEGMTGGLQQFELSHLSCSSDTDQRERLDRYALKNIFILVLNRSLRSGRKTPSC